MSLSSGKTTRNAPKPQVSPVVVAALVIALLAFVIWRGVAAFSGPKAGPLPPPPTQDIAFLQQKAKECQGDFAKLSPADQTKVQQLTHGFGAAAMASNYRQLSQGAH
ncbi:MAG TPA: hypothetical protein VFB21_17670 [Chthonomonadaceae bacterium]|nr:hypothetical protein [Chthonomonadaceae bacterium]